MTRDELIDQLLDVLDDEGVAPAAVAAPAPAAQPSVVTRYLLADHQAARLRDELRRLEMRELEVPGAPAGARLPQGQAGRSAATDGAPAGAQQRPSAAQKKNRARRARR